MTTPSPLVRTSAEVLAIQNASHRVRGQIEAARRRLARMEQEIRSAEERTLGVFAPISTPDDCAHLGADAVEIALAAAAFVAAAERTALAAIARRDGGAK